MFPNRMQFSINQSFLHLTVSYWRRGVRLFSIKLAAVLYEVLQVQLKQLGSDLKSLTMRCSLRECCGAYQVMECLLVHVRIFALF